MQQFNKLVDGIIYVPGIHLSNEMHDGSVLIVTDHGLEYLMISQDQFVAFIDQAEDNYPTTKQKFQSYIPN